MLNLLPQLFLQDLIFVILEYHKISGLRKIVQQKLTIWNMMTYIKSSK